MDEEDDANAFFLKSIRKELITILEGVDDKDEAKFRESGLAASEFVPNRMGPSNSTIDNDLVNMHLNLKKSYELFQTIGDRLESINFCCLKSRIKDLHINDKSDESIKEIVDDFKKRYDQKRMEARLIDLTKKVGTKFRKHPGEFGDIPELSEFFRACTQLQHGLEKLKKQRNEIQDITRRMNHVVEMSYDRVNEIQQKLEADPTFAKVKIANEKVEELNLEGTK
uniref:Uncharacterized protein n=1 Tax=Stomoxys calcitrans TaxID=35570 RepID=A0A1I8P3D6_STOCA